MSGYRPGAPCYQAFLDGIDMGRAYERLEEDISLVKETDMVTIDRAAIFHRHHRKRLGVCWRCLRRYPCGVIRAFEHGYVVGWDAVTALAALAAQKEGA